MGFLSDDFVPELVHPKADPFLDKFAYLYFGCFFGDLNLKLVKVYGTSTPSEYKF